MKKRVFGWISAVIGVVMALAAVEVMAIAWMMLEDGRYTPASELFERTQNTYVRDLTRGTSCRYVDTLFPHPYLAFVHHANPPCGIGNVNNVGLRNDDFPTLKRQDRFVVLLTGGSVASQLGQNWPAPAPRFLEQELNKRFVSPNGKPWQVLNGGSGSWKQPQQFILFSLYVTSVDAVVALDGYNERFLFIPGTGERLERAFNNFLEVNPFASDENFGDAAIGWVMGRIAGTLAAAPVLGHSHAVYMIVRGIETMAKGQGIFRPTNKKTTAASLFALPEEIIKDKELHFETQLGLYQKYMRGIEAVARDNDVKTAYFIQPVPAWGKTLTEEEKRVVGDLSYGDLYRRMVAGLLTLRARGLAVHDLGDMLQNEAGTIYEDHIHFAFTPEFDSKGYRLMAARMADVLGETWQLKAK